MTKIVEKYFEKNNFGQKADDILKKITSETGFEPRELLFKGVIYDQDKLGSLIYKGIFKDKEAVLKIQGLRPEIDEIDIIINFSSQNESSRVRLPQLFESKHWNRQDGYGYLITEYINAPHIFEMPFANREQMQRFCEFYQEHRRNCLKVPFVKQTEEKNAADFVLARADMWGRIAQSKGILKKRLSEKKTNKVFDKFEKIMGRQLQDVKMVFCHGHLTANDIFDNGESFVLLSNLYWSFRPEFYDLVFGLHWCLENINDNSFSYSKFLSYIKTWLLHFYNIPIVKKDPDAKRKINLMLLERTLGGILLDTGSKPLDDPTANHLLELQCQFFDELSKRAEERKYL